MTPAAFTCQWKGYTIAVQIALGPGFQQSMTAMTSCLYTVKKMRVGLPRISDHTGLLFKEMRSKIKIKIRR